MKWGNVQIPWTVSWTGEEKQFVGPYRFTGGMLALRMPVAAVQQASLGSSKAMHRRATMMQVEPMVHKPCSIYRERRAARAPGVEEPGAVRDHGLGIYPSLCSDYVAQPTDRIVGHAKVELLRWRDRDEAWLRGAIRESKK